MLPVPWGTTAAPHSEQRGALRGVTREGRYPGPHRERCGDAMCAHQLFARMSWEISVSSVSREKSVMTAGHRHTD